MTLSFLDFWCGEILNYTGKEGVIVFLYQKTLKTLINGIFQHKQCVINFTLTMKNRRFFYEGIA
jgi:hypothetical protein